MVRGDRPRVVLLHFATNDVWSGRSNAQIPDAWTTVVRQLRAVDPHVVVVAAQIIPVAPPTCADCPARTATSNAAVPGWAAATSTAASPVLVVDHATGWDPARDTSDGVHPNDAGTAGMAAARPADRPGHAATRGPCGSPSSVGHPVRGSSSGVSPAARGTSR